MQKPRIRLDCETHPIAQGRAAPRLAWLQYRRQGDPGGVVLLERKRALQAIPELLRPGHVLVGHNIGFDMAVWCMEGFTREVFEKYQAGEVEDTLVNQTLLDIALGYARQRPKLDLRSCCTRMGCATIPDKEDPWRLRYGELEEVRPEVAPAGAVAYATIDVVSLEELDDAQHEGRGLLTNPGWYARNAFALHLMTVTGLATDAEAVQRYHRIVHARAERDKRRLFEAGLIDHKGKRNTKIAAALMERTAPNGKRTKGGGVCLDATACKAAAMLCKAKGDGDESGKLLMAYSAYGSAKARQKRLMNLYAGLLHPAYSYPKETGRTSSRGEGILPGDQIQNPPKEPGYRECYVPPPGWALCSTDWAADELACWSQVCHFMLGYSDMGDRINEGLDLHTYMGTFRYEQLAGRAVTYAELAALVEAGDPVAKQARQDAKIANFGLAGGMGAAKFAASFGLPLETAKAIVAAWRKAWRQAKDYLAWAADEARFGDGTVRQYGSGRLRKLDEARAYSQAANTMFQGYGADSSMDSLWALTWACYLGEDLDTRAPSILLGSRPVAFLHDEFLSIHPPPGVYNNASISDRAKEFARVQIFYKQKWFPDVRVHTEPAICDRWSKNMGTVTDANGDLVFWVPKGGWDAFYQAAEKPQDEIEWDDEDLKPDEDLDDEDEAA